MIKYKTLRNRRNINIDMYLCETENGKYILAIPEALKDDAEMFVETFNSGGKQRNNYGENVADAISDNGNGIETTIMDAITDFPVVMPIVPDIIGLPDFQQLSLESVRDFKIHERVIQCIEDAKTEIESITGKTVKEKIFLHGYSASGVFAQRFALIYPEIIGRCLIGGAAGSIPVPTKKIKYPIGIEDFEELFGKDFNMDDYKLIKFGYYVGEKEEQDTGEWGIDGEKFSGRDGIIRAPMHDMSFRGASTPKEVGMVQRQYLGQTMNQRYKNSIEANKKIGIDIEGIILKDAGHKYIFDSKVTPTSQCLIRQLLNFYNNNMQLNPKGEGCCCNLDESFQKAREAQSMEKDIIKYNGYKLKIVDFLKKIFNKSSKQRLLNKPKTKDQEYIEFLDVYELCKMFIDAITPELENIRGKYGEIPYEYSLQTKVSAADSIEIVKKFFASIDKEKAKKVNDIISGTNPNIILETKNVQHSEATSPHIKPVRVRVPIRGDIRQLYEFAHECAHTFDIDNGATDTRRVLGEVAPQCIERLLDDFFLEMSAEEMKKYGFDKKVLEQDIKDRRISTFFSRLLNVEALNEYNEFSNGNILEKDRKHPAADPKVDLRYLLAQIYSAHFNKFDKSQKKNKLIKFIECVNKDNFNGANKCFGMQIGKKYKLKRGFYISDTISEIEALIEQRSQTGNEEKEQTQSMEQDIIK